MNKKFKPGDIVVVINPYKSSGYKTGVVIRMSYNSKEVKVDLGSSSLWFKVTEVKEYVCTMMELN